MRFLLPLALLLFATPSFAIKKIQPDPAAQKLVFQVLDALRTADKAERIKKVLPLVHKSLKTKDGKALTRSIEQYSFKKASKGAANYVNKIHEVHEGRVSTVGFRETAQRCRRDKYFVVAKDPQGKGFRPAPIHVCVPEDGSAPKILDFGSLN